MRIKEKRMKSFVSRANVLTQAKKQTEAAKAVSDGLQYYSNNVMACGAYLDVIAETFNSQGIPNLIRNSDRPA